MKNKELLKDLKYYFTCVEKHFKTTCDWINSWTYINIEGNSKMFHKDDLIFKKHKLYQLEYYLTTILLVDDAQFQSQMIYFLKEDKEKMNIILNYLITSFNHEYLMVKHGGVIEDMFKKYEDEHYLNKRAPHVQDAYKELIEVQDEIDKIEKELQSDC